jgi:hypothetical protein
VTTAPLPNAFMLILRGCEGWCVGHGANVLLAANAHN